jgi:DNA processing protein
VDEIRNQTGLPIERVSATLTMLELKGLVRQTSGMNFVAVREDQAEYLTAKLMDVEESKKKGI